MDDLHARIRRAQIRAGEEEVLKHLAEVEAAPQQHASGRPMERHTPGPWSYEVHRLSEGPSAIVYDGNGHRIADHLSEADARLIAAAPTLLSSLKNVISAWEGKSGMGTLFEMQRAIPDARAAILSAEGR